MAPRVHIGRRAPRERGAALLTAMVAVAVLTALAVDLAYTSRVSLQIAANGRDELRAQYLARSGVQMGRMLLSFQEQLDAQAKGLPNVPRIQISTLVPVGPSLTDGLFGGGATPPAQAEAEAARSATSTWDARIEDEARKVNAHLDGLAQGADRKLWTSVMGVYQLTCDARWDPIFDREDEHGIRVTREDLLVYLRDWVDTGTASSALTTGGGTGAQCGLVVGQPPFAQAFGDKNQLYDRGEERYKTKNARMDSLDELYLVAGVGDAFMAAFGDSLTVYLPRDAKRNVNGLDRRGVVEVAKLVADPPGQPTLFTEEFADALFTAYQKVTLGGILTITAKDLGALISFNKVNVNQNLLVEGPNAPFTSSSTTFRIRASGKVGAVRSTIDAVVRIGEQPQAGDPVAVPGRIIHWRED
jgi:general secretion pathway protein K